MRHQFGPWHPSACPRSGRCTVQPGEGLLGSLALPHCAREAACEPLLCLTLLRQHTGIVLGIQFSRLPVYPWDARTSQGMPGMESKAFLKSAKQLLALSEEEWPRILGSWNERVHDGDIITCPSALVP